jgi:hypothetical protein
VVWLNLTIQISIRKWKNENWKPTCVNISCHPKRIGKRLVLAAEETFKENIKIVKSQHQS